MRKILKLFMQLFHGLAILTTVAADETVPYPFHPLAVHAAQIQLSEESVAALNTSPREYASGTITMGDQTFADVGVRLKGHGTFKSLSEKPNLTIKFNEFVPKQKCHGFRKLMFNNSLADPSYMCAFLGNELFRKAGVPAPNRFGGGYIVEDILNPTGISTPTTFAAQVEEWKKNGCKRYRCVFYIPPILR